MTGSILLHIGALVVLWFTPVRNIVFQQHDPEEFQVTARGDRIEEMVEHLREREADFMEDDLQELFDIEEEMATILDERQEQFETLAMELMEDAPTKALKAQLEAMQAQSTALDAQDRLANEPPKGGEPIFNEVTEAQADASDSQLEADQALAFTPPVFDKARAQQTEAAKVQTRAAEARDQANSLSQQTAQADRQVTDSERQAKSESERATREEARVPEAETRVTKAEQAVAEARNKETQVRAKYEKAQSDEQAAKAAHEEARQALNDTSSPADKRRVEDLKRTTEARKRSADGVQRELTRAAATIRDREKSEQRTEQQLADTKRKADEARKRADDAKQATADAATKAKALNQSLQATRTAARDDQQKARQLQKAAHETLKQSIAEAQAHQGDVRMVPQAVTAEAPSFEKQIIRAGMDIPAVYDQATATENRIAESYKHVHATEVAMVRHVPVPAALSETVVPKTDRPELNEELLTKDVRTADGAEAHRAEVDRANQEMSAMVTAANRLLNKAQGGEDGMSVSLASFRAAGAQARQLRDLAAEDEQKRFKDLAAVMRDGASEGTKSPGAGAPGRSGQARQFSDPGRNPTDVVPGRIVAVSGNRPRVMVARASDKPAQWLTPKWMYVDAWYTIGPFPNPGRRNIDTQFPPESVIDLDASYGGKDGRRVKWKFINNAHPGIFPNDDESYGIYYAYTELWFEEPMDLVVAVGSDDNSRLWVEGSLVWMSGRQLKSWRANEGFRTVHFKKGLNRVLYRVENGWKETLYSLMICLDKG